MKKVWKLGSPEDARDAARQKLAPGRERRMQQEAAARVWHDDRERRGRARQ